ncbi:class I SAM-dependent methyltransferase [Aquisphaera insulae]|uniref:class I SAM-dependent methyltransferase n=1 Tax=Aquisphaera insulae TaxID=2712864 RepID=UPI0013E9F79C|nr:class I SAM-dependent methyltransferase [Aquisphaera insulae]
MLKARYSVLDLVAMVLILGTAFGLVSWQWKNRLMESTSQVRSQLLKAVFQSPLPGHAVTAERPVPDSEAYKGKYQFSDNWFTYHIPVWERVLAPFQGKPGVQYLEVGLYEGRSAVWMLEHVLTHPTARLTGIDPFLGPYKSKYHANIESSGLSPKVTTIADYSQVALRKLPLNAYDIIYVDGSHAKDDVLEDAVLCSRLLKEGGILIFDDYQWVGCMAHGTCDSAEDFPKAAIDPFVQCFEKEFEVIHNSNQLILRRRKAPLTPGSA